MERSKETWNVMRHRPSERFEGFFYWKHLKRRDTASRFMILTINHFAVFLRIRIER